MKNPSLAIMSSILSIILIIAEIILLIQVNISTGIKKETVENMIDDINIKKELKNQEEYKELNRINPIITDEIITSDEFEIYFKENLKAVYKNIIYNEKNEYIKSDNLKIYINQKIEEFESEEFTEEDKELMLDKTNSIIHELDNAIEEIQKNDISGNILSIIMSKTASYILLLGTVFIAGLIIIINRTKESLLWVGVPTIISGILFYILSIEIKINAPLGTFRLLLNDITKTLKTTGTTTIIIGLLTIIIYIIQTIKKESEQNGTI